VALEVLYVYDYVIKLCETQAEVLPNYINPIVCGIVEEENRHRKYKKLKLGGDQAYDRSAD
jgi:hypothetical protein